jgi:phage terminase large subunit GpA-like protein
MIDARLRQALIGSSALLRPPPATTLIEWADSYRQVPSGTSASPGRWRTSAQPSAYGPMSAVVEPDTHTVTVMASTQTVKSELLLNVCGYYIAADASAILLIRPTQGDAESFSKERFAPMVACTPVLRALVATPRSRLADATITHRSFPGGSLDIVGSNSPTDLASRPKRIILADEIDKFPPSAGSEGDPLKLGEERASTYKNIGRSLCVRTCSPTDRSTSRVFREFGFSDMRKLYVECPHCNYAQTLKWKNVDFKSADGHAPETAGMVCEECGVKWSERERREALAALEFAPAYGWRQTANFTCCGQAQAPEQWDDEGRSRCKVCGERSPYEGHAGFHISKLYSLRHRLSDIAKEFLEAQTDRELLRKFVNTALAEVWEDELGQGVDASGLAARAESYGQDSLPAGVEVILCGVDTQPDRLEMQFLGHGKGGEMWVVAYEILHGDPNQGYIWRDFEKVVTQPFHRVDGKVLFCRAAAVDSGGHNTQAVYDYCASRRVVHANGAVNLFATKGASVPAAPIWTKRPLHSQNHKPFYLVGVHNAKEAVANLLRTVPNPDGSPTRGCVHFPRGEYFGPEYFKQLAAEKREEKWRFGVPYTRWVLPSGARNEAWDTLILAYVLRYAFSASDQVMLSPIPRPTAPAPIKPQVPAEMYEPPEQPEQPERNKMCPQIDNVTGNSGGWLGAGRGWWERER